MLRSLAQKVLVMALLFIGVACVSAGIVIFNVLTLQSETTHLAEDVAARSELIGDFNTHLTRVIGEVEAYIYSGVEEDLQEARLALQLAQGDANKLAALTVDAHVSTNITDAYRSLDTRRQSLFYETQQLLTAVSANHIPPSDVLATLEQAKVDLAEMEEGVDLILDQEIASGTDEVAAGSRLVLISSGGMIGLVILLTFLMLFLLQGVIVKPVTTLAAAATAVSTGVLDQTVQVTSNDEVGALQRAFNALTATIREQTEHLQQQVLTANTARAEAEAARAKIAAQLATIEAQEAVIREISVPILPLGPTALVMPLVGALDSARLQLMQQQALHAIEQRAVRSFIFDLTGVPIIDTQVADALVGAAKAVKLLGAQAMLTGIRPEVAQTLVGLGADLSSVMTHGSLQAGIAYVMQQR
jgi:rsbT co-antagonist protein RsbR